MKDELPLVEAEDVEVLMHRDAHFGGQFAIMLDYYGKEVKGAMLEVERIERLAELEEELGENLAPYVLEGAQAERVAQAIEAYHKLRAIYEIEERSHPHLIADLILCEEAEEEGAIAQVVAQGDLIVEPLMQLLAAGDLADPLFPGYGYGPALAARCLGEIGTERAIAPLFESIGHHNEELDTEALDALVRIGEPAQNFLIKLLGFRPVNRDTEAAAAALSAFHENEEIGRAALELLKEPDVLRITPLSVYLAICCAGLKDPADRDELRILADALHIPKETREEILNLLG